ncbi:MAG: DegT/DnrJ/EryC1/StrS aminotransferase family protein [Bryobacterales bacterium]|nr:DegT/DnrJ/EryC1/StrS aminotransferase family protein [Bryobacterales bacterium]
MDDCEIDEPFLVFGQPCLGEEEIAEVVACLRSGWIGRGPRVTRFERDFAAYKGVDEAVSVQSCSAALLLALQAAGVGPGDEVITTPLTYCATINAIIHAGAQPVLADVDPATMNLSPARVAERITANTRAIIPVHFAGRPCEMDLLRGQAERHGLTLIEDCAHAIETEYQGRKAGTIGDFGCFSFYPTKNVTTGEGGMVLARDAKHRETIRILSTQGMTLDAWKRFSADGVPHYAVVAAGFKYNMTDMEAALGIHQLARVEANWLRRREIWLHYRDALTGLPVTLPAMAAPGTRHAYHLFPILVDPRVAGLDRDGFLLRLRELRIGSAVHYRSAAEQPYYQSVFGWQPEDVPEAMRIGRQTLSLPLSPALSDHDVERVVRAVRTVLDTPRQTAALRASL